MKESNIIKIEEALLPLLDGIFEGTLKYDVLSEELETTVKIEAINNPLETWMKINIKQPMGVTNGELKCELSVTHYFNGDAKAQHCYAIRDHVMPDSMKTLLNRIAKLAVAYGTRTAVILDEVNNVMTSLDLSKK